MRFGVEDDFFEIERFFRRKEQAGRATPKPLRLALSPLQLAYIGILE